MPEEEVDNDAHNVPAAPGHQCAPGSETVNHGHAPNQLAIVLQLAVVSIPPVAPGDQLVVQQPATAPNNQPTTAGASTNTAPPANATSTTRTSTGAYTTEEVDTLKSIIFDDFGGQPFKGDWQNITDTFRQLQPPGRTLYGLRKKWYFELKKLEDERLASQDGEQDSSSSSSSSSSNPSTTS